MIAVLVEASIVGGHRYLLFFYDHQGILTRGKEVRVLSTTEQETTTATCPSCGRTLNSGVCVNPDCTEAQKAASAGASRETAKATAAAAGAEVARQPQAPAQPRSFASSGRPD